MLATAAAWQPPARWVEGLTDPPELRLARAFPGGARGGGRAHAARLALARERVPEGAQLYVLVDPVGAAGFADLLAAARMERLLWPRFVQPITALPVPDTASEGARAGRPVWLLDVQAKARPRRAGFELVTEAAGARLWRALP